MSTTIVIDGKRVFLKDLLGKGAMANVYLVEHNGAKLAAKIYQYDGDPGKELMRPVREKKIPQMINLPLPETVLSPRHIIKSDKGEFLGFTMPLMPKGFVPLAELYSRSFWARQLITPTKVLKIMRSLRDKLVMPVHETGLVICDFNPGNAEFHVSKFDQVLGCDVDSYQIRGFNGREIHMAYGAPRLFNKDLASGSFSFLPEDDWWSYYVHFVTGMTRGGHPFRGKGEWFRKQSDNMEVPERVLAGLSIFHPKVETIGGALPISIMPDDVLHHLQTVLVHQKRATGPMPEWVFKIQFKMCHTCQTEYARQSCPVCQAVVYIPRVVMVAAVEFVPDIFTTTASIVASAIVNGEIVVIMRRPDSFGYVRLKADGHIVAKHDLALPINMAEQYIVSIGEKHVVIADSELLHVFDHTGKEISTTTTNSFMSRPTFGVSDTIYRAVGASISRWETIGGRLAYRPVVQHLPIGSTWIEACPAGVVFMTFVAGQYSWGIFSGKSRLPIPVQRIPVGYHLVRQYVVASDQKSVSIFRVIENTQGSQRTLIDQFDLMTKAVISKMFAAPIHQAAVMSGTILFGSDDGLMVWKQTEAQPTVREGTQSVIQVGDEILLASQSAIVVARSHSISVLKAK